MKKVFKIAVLPGDGVGPEVTGAAVSVLRKIAENYDYQFDFSYADFGAIAIEKTGNPLPDKTLDLCKKSDAILFGAIGDPKYDNDTTAKIRPEQGLLKLRKSLNLFSNLRPVKIYPQLLDSSPIKNDRLINVDFIVVRELTGGIYFGEPRLRKDQGKTAIDTCVYSKSEIIRVAKVAFNLATRRKRKVTSVDKANVLETSRLWRDTVNEVSIEFPGISLDHMFIDNASMQLIKKPSAFDVILTENMFGDILTDEASVISGSIGLLPSASIGESASSADLLGLYEPIHGAFNRAAGKNIANPIGTILSTAMMLAISFKLENESQIIEKAIEKVLDKGYRTKDLTITDTESKKILGTKEMGEKIAEFIK